jgi:hypothetical protein
MASPAGLGTNWLAANLAPNLEFGAGFCQACEVFPNLDYLYQISL